MKPPRYLVILAICALSVGCRATKQDTELLERELRLQEDRIYELEYCLDAYEKRLLACRSENSALRRELRERGGSGDDFLPPRAPSAPEVELGPGGFLPERGEPGFPAELDPGQYEEAPPFNPPIISPPGEETYEEVPGARSTRGGSQRVSQIPVAAAGGAALAGHAAPRPGAARANASVGERLGRAEALLDRVAAAHDPAERVADPVHDLEVVDVTLNKMLTGGMDRDKRGGDEGILVVIEPRNHKNQIVQAFGQISVVVLDPALSGEDARIARWDITPQELEHRFRGRQFGRGFQLELPWPGDPPQHSDLHLFVRFVGDDGRKLIVDRELKINPPGGEKDGGWVPATRSGVVIDESVPAMTAPRESHAEARPAQPDEPRPLTAPRANLATRPIGDRPAKSANGASSTAAGGWSPAAGGLPASRSDAGEVEAAANPPHVARAPETPTTSGKRRPQWTPYR